MHVKLNVIKLFNRLSLLANQNTSTSIQQSMSIVSQPGAINGKAPSNLTNINNYNKLSDTKSDDSDCHKNLNNVSSSPIKSSNSQKFIMSSSFQLHEDDLSKIDVKSLVRIKVFLLTYTFFSEGKVASSFHVLLSLCEIQYIFLSHLLP